MYLAGSGAAAGRVPVPRRSPRSCATLPADLEERVLLAVDCANERRIGEDTAAVDRARLVVNVDHHHDNSRFGDVNLDRPRRVVDGRGRSATSCASSTSTLTPRDRPGALRRSRHRYRPLPVHEHDAEGAPARRRARRGRRRRPRDLPARLRDGAVREAEAARARARPRAALRGRAARRLVPAAGRLRRGRGGGAVLGGDHRPPARGRGLGDGRADPRAAARRGAGAPDLAALEPRRGRRLGDRAEARAAAAIRRRPASRPRSRSSEIIEFLRREFAHASHGAVPSRGRCRPVGVALVDKPAGPSSFAIVAALRRRTGARTGHAGTLDPFATGLLVLLSGAATRLAPCFVGLDKRYVTDVDLTATTSTGDPEGEVLERHPAPDRVDGGVGARAPPG